MEWVRGKQIEKKMARIPNEANCWKRAYKIGKKKFYVGCVSLKFQGQRWATRESSTSWHNDVITNANDTEKRSKSNIPFRLQKERNKTEARQSTTQFSAGMFINSTIFLSLVVKENCYSDYSCRFFRSKLILWYYHRLDW